MRKVKVAATQMACTDNSDENIDKAVEIIRTAKEKGANIICFTTGRGSCFGFKPVPSIKIATNTNMYNRMKEDMDINSGTIMDGLETVEENGIKIYKNIIEVASGKKSKSEINGYGDDEFNPWVIGATL